MNRPPNLPLRTSAVAFLNGRPLYHTLRGTRCPRWADGTPLFEIQEALPADCADQLERGHCDLALVPVASYAANPEWEVVPGVGIGCRGPVETVVVASNRPIEEIRHIHLDAASRSSVLLLLLLLRALKLQPTLSTAPHRRGIDKIKDDHAALIIGDAAFGLQDRFPYIFDLGEQWFRITGLPFVFAFWAARPGVLSPEHVHALQHARNESLNRHAESIAQAYRNERVDAGLNVARENYYANYLRKTIRYGLETDQREGLAEFLSRIHESGIHPIAGLSANETVHVKFAGSSLPQKLMRARVKRVKPLSTDELLTKSASGERLDLAEGIFLYENASLMDLGLAADRRRQQLHPHQEVTYIVDRNVNYTNYCVTRCKFCNFYVPPGSGRGYVLSRTQLAEKFRETEELGGVQILLQGGLNPELGIEYYEDLFRWTKANFTLKLHALSPTEIVHIARIENLSIANVLLRLKRAGMDSLPGGGAEILDDEVRNRISPFKNSTDEWLEVMRQAHLLGMKSTATMVFGFQETSEQLFMHLDRIRELQSETRGFTAFIAWPFQAEGTRLKLRDDTSACRYLRIQALARLYLDNVPNIQVSWPTLGPAVGELGLRFGANDFGSVMIEENVVSTAGAHFMLDAKQIEDHIRMAGFRPVRRNMQYERLSRTAKETIVDAAPPPC